MFLYIARGSAGEVRSMLQFCDRWPESAHLKSQISDLISLAESCSRQLRAWAGSLQDSDIKGQRHLNQQTRQTYDSKRRADAFMRQIDESVRAHQAGWSKRAILPFEATSSERPPDGAGRLSIRGQDIPQRRIADRTCRITALRSQRFSAPFMWVDEGP